MVHLHIQWYKAGSFGKIDSMKNNCITKIIKMKHQDSKLMFFLHPLIAVDSQLLLIYQWCCNGKPFGKIPMIININLVDSATLSELSTRKISEVWPLRKLLSRYLRNSMWHGMLYLGLIINKLDEWQGWISHQNYQQM